MHPEAALATRVAVGELLRSPRAHQSVAYQPFSQALPRPTGRLVSRSWAPSPLHVVSLQQEHRPPEFITRVCSCGGNAQAHH